MTHFTGQGVCVDIDRIIKTCSLFKIPNWQKFSNRNQDFSCFPKNTQKQTKLKHFYQWPVLNL